MVKSRFKALNVIQRLDEQSLLFVQGYRNAIFNGLFRVLSFTGESRTWMISSGLLYVLHRFGYEFIPEHLTFLQAMFAPLLAWFVAVQIKRIVGRRRPPEKVAGCQPLGFVPPCGSFPSGHTAAVVAMCLTLLLVGHSWWWQVGLWALGVSFSRLYLGVHFLSDILGGALLGLLCSALIVSLRVYLGY